MRAMVTEMKPGPSRRAVLGGLALSAAAPMGTWAAAGGARFLSAAKLGEEDYALIGLTGEGEEAFRLKLPGRGHAAAAHPFRPLAVAFARRPGDFALILNCVTGEEIARLNSPEGRHFYGHGVFSRDGALLFTTENEIGSGEGRIGVWDTQDFRRVGEFASAGIGPHDLKLAADGEALIVANGGIRTHPEMGRAKLNIPTMRPNIAWLDPADGTVLDMAEPAEKRRMNSLRHLALRGDMVAIGAQWEGDLAEAPPLVAIAKRGEGLKWASASPREWAMMRGYISSIAITGDGREIAVTSSHGGAAMLFDAETLVLKAMVKAEDVSGAATLGQGFATSSGTGIWAIRAGDGVPLREIRHRVAFDNHLVAI